MIKGSKLKKMISIMASDILNPIKFNYMFNHVVIKNMVDTLKFIIRPDENITISI